jgi:hypothetical protein
LIKINLLVIGKIIKKPITSVANPGIIKSKAAKAIAGPRNHFISWHLVFA